jgi:hypothetical protein
MASLTLSQFQTEVLLTLDNMPTDDPIASSGIHTRGINRAPNRLIRMVGNADLFPEKHNTWTIGPTVVGDNTIALPSDCIIAQRLVSADSSSLPDWADTEERFISPIPRETIGLLAKPTSGAGYPQQWDRKAEQILYHPTTRTGYTTYLRLYGIARESAISSASDQFTISEDWDDAIVLLAAEYCARRMDGWQRRADEFLVAAKLQIDETMNVLGAERAVRPLTINIAGMPR